MMLSVTPDGVIGPGFVTSTPSLPAGQSPAKAAPAPISDAVKRTAAAEAARSTALPTFMLLIMCSLRLRSVGGDRSTVVGKIMEGPRKRKYRLPLIFIAAGYGDVR